MYFLGKGLRSIWDDSQIKAYQQYRGLKQNYLETYFVVK